MTARNRATLQSEGYVLFRGVVDQGEVARLREAADRLVEAAGASCVRRILVKSPAFADLAVASSIIERLPPGLWPVRGILFDKTSERNWPVGWHRDTTIAVKERRETEGYGPWTVKEGVVHVCPPTGLLAQMTSVRIHLDDTPESNGALRVIPGSHVGSPLPGAERAEEMEAATCECRTGDVLLMSPLLLHSSPRAVDPCRRRVIHIEYAPLAALHSRLEWSESVSQDPSAPGRDGSR